MVCTFQDSWVRHPDYKLWVIPVKGNNLRAKCKLCDKILDVSTMGITALKSHNSGYKHCMKVQSHLHNRVPNFVTSVNHTGTSDQVNLMQGEMVPHLVNSQLAETTHSQAEITMPQVTVKNYVDKRKHIQSEMWWTLNTVDKNHSFSSNSDNNFLFGQMFPDSNHGAKFSCGETKSMYLSNHALAPYFKQLLLRNVSKKHYVILFNESLNEYLQKKQADFHVIFWFTDRIVHMYFTTFFLGRACSVDLYKCFESLTWETECLVQISMDGPYVNWVIFKLVQQTLKDKYDRTLLNTQCLQGSYGSGTVETLKVLKVTDNTVS